MKVVVMVKCLEEMSERSGEWKGRSLSARKINYRGGFDGFVKRIGDDR